MKKLISALAAFATVCVTAASLVANAAYIDPSGNDGVTASDSLYIQKFLAGLFPSYNLNSMDIDMNGIVSEMDSDKILSYLTNRDSLILPEAPANYDTTTLKNIEERTYRKHKYSSSSSTSYSTYTVKRPSASNMLSSDYDCMPMGIIGDNNMVRDTDSAVVRLRDPGGVGTGFIVGKHVIATAAHCVYNKTNGAYIDNNIEVVDENNNIIDSFHAESVHVPTNYKNYSNNNDHVYYDYALLYVPSVDLSEYGMFSLGVAKDEFITDTSNKVSVSGFPVGYPSGYENTPYGLRFKASGNIYNAVNTQYCLSYTADTTGGVSGGPVYVEEGFFGGDNLWHNYKTVIGINAYGASSDKEPICNFGVKITPELLTFYNHNQYLN